MGSSNTGNLDKGFLGSTITIPVTTTTSSNGFQSNKGNVSHDVSSSGTPVTARNPDSATVTTGVNRFTGKST